MKTKLTRNEFFEKYGDVCVRYVPTDHYTAKFKENHIAGYPYMWGKLDKNTDILISVTTNNPPHLAYSHDVDYKSELYTYSPCSKW